MSDTERLPRWHQRRNSATAGRFREWLLTHTARPEEEWEDVLQSLLVAAFHYATRRDVKQAQQDGFLQFSLDLVEGARTTYLNQTCSRCWLGDLQADCGGLCARCAQD